MRKKYTICSPYGTPREYKRRDVAARKLMEITYNAIAAQGGLDTLWGHKLYDDVKRVSDDIASGTMLDFSVKLPHNCGTIRACSINF